MKKKFLVFLMAATSVMLTVTSCNQDDEDNAPETEVEIGDRATVNISASENGIGNRTFDKDTIYVLNGFVFVNSGQTLTIEAGTIIKAKPGQAENASALIVAKGGKIMAEGSAEAPIIFTAEADDLTKTDDLPVNAKGLWGGVIILGDAPINRAAGTASIEGIPTTETRAIYGGSNADDNSGIFKYVSIRHSGSIIGGSNEINGLTLGGVGRGTVVEFVEVFANLDDGFEFFGGTVNTRNLIAALADDDSYDWDFGYRGENQFWVALQEPGGSTSLPTGSRGGELDGASSDNLTTSDISDARVYNATIIGAKRGGNNDKPTAFHITDNPGARFYNSIIMNFDRGIDIPEGANREFALANFANGKLDFKNNIWWNVSDNTLEGIADGGFAELVTVLNAGANAVKDPMLAAIPNTFVLSAKSLDPLPAAGSPALTDARTNVPSASNGFTYSNAAYIGAFGTDNWAKGWTALDAYGLLK